MTFQKPINKKVRFYYANILINAKIFLLKGVERQVVRVFEKKSPVLCVWVERWETKRLKKKSSFLYAAATFIYIFTAELAFSS